MKKFIIIAALLLTAINASAQTGKELYRKYSDSENVSAVYISPAMFRLIGKIPDMELGSENVNLAPIIRSLSGLYILSSDNAKINDHLVSDANKMIDRGEFEMLMEAKDNGQVVRMFTAGDEKIVNSFVMIASEGPEATFICIDGVINRADLEALLAEEMK